MSDSPKVLGSPLMTIKNELLHGAVVRGELPTVRRLLDRHRADINTKNSNGLSCLQLAILNGHTKLAEYLIQKGVDIHVSDAEGFTALHDAALVENTLLVRKLISKGLSPFLTTKMGELVIDVAGSLQMEKVLCEEMFCLGACQLARQYYIYLGLDCDPPLGSARVGGGASHHHGSSRSHHPKTQSMASKTSSPKTTSRKEAVQSKSEVSAAVSTSTRAERVQPTALPPATADSALSRRCNTNDVCKRNRTNCLTDGGLDCLPDCVAECSRNHKNVRESSNYKDFSTPEHSITTTQKNSATTLEGQHPKSSGSNSEEKEKKLHNPADTNKEDQLARHGCGSNSSLSKCNLSPGPTREEKAIKTLYQHSGFQFQIGLALHSKQFSSLDEEEEVFESPQQKSSADSNSAVSSSNRTASLPSPSSPRGLSRHKRVYTEQQQTGTTEKLERASSLKNRPSRFPRPLQKSVSFADLSSTRSKPMYIGSSADNDKQQDITRQGDISPNILKNFISNFGRRSKSSSSAQGGGGNSEDIDGMFDAGIRALRMKPRKSSIASPMKRRSTGETTTAEVSQRRRSVTFQPEVLLQEIVTDGDVKAVSEILESGMIADVNKMSPSGLTALHQSAIDGNLECAKALVAKGANVNCTDCEKWTPLHAAVMNGSIEFVRFLLDSGAKPTLKNDNEETAYDMAKSGPIKKMLLHAMNGKSLDADDFSDVEYSGEEEEEYSHAESESDDDLEGEGSCLFESNGESTSLKERLGLTHASALKNTHTNSISPSPDLDIFPSGHRGSSSHVYHHKRDQELTDSTSSYGSLFDVEECEDEDYNAGDSMVKQTSSSSLSSPKIDSSDTDKNTESGISTMEGSSDCSHRSRVLSSEDLVIGVDSELEEGSLDHEYQESCLYCDVDRVLKLVKHKHEIDVNRVNKISGITALHHSVLEENFALVQHLVKDFDADLHVQDIEGWTPLHAASAVGSIQIAQFLLDRGAKPSSLNFNCEFPVDVAEDEAMEKLLKNAMLSQSSTEKVSKR